MVGLIAQDHQTHQYVIKITGKSKRPDLESLNKLSTQPTVSTFISLKNASETTRDVKKINLNDYYVFSSKGKMDINRLKKDLEPTFDIEYIEPLCIRKTFYEPDDPQNSKQDYLDIIKAFEAWDYTKGSKEVVVAIIDSGIDYEHEDLNENLYLNENEIPNNGLDDDKDGFVDNYLGWDFVGADYENIIPDSDPIAQGNNTSHGTQVVGCAAASTDNGVGISGTGFNARFMALKCSADNDERENGRSFIINSPLAVLYAADHGADVINMSYGGTEYSQFENDVITYAAIEKDVVLIASAGNSDTTEFIYPAAYEHVLSVGATDFNDLKASFSQFGHWVDLSAPGEGIFTTSVNNKYKTVQGTSYSGPIVAGAAALLRAAFPEFSQEDIRALLKTSADDIDPFNPTYIGQLGGRLNMKEAVELANSNADFQVTTTISYPEVELDFKPKNLKASSYSWDFGDGVTKDGMTPSHQYSQPGTYDVSLTIVTRDERIITQTNNNFIRILSHAKIPYELMDGGDFEDSASNFAPLSVSGSQFELGNSVIKGKDGTHSGTKAWVIGMTEEVYQLNTIAYLYTPLYSFKGLGDYKLSFHAKYDIEEKWDGFILEYTVDKGETWYQLNATIEDQWYNELASNGAFSPNTPIFSGSSPDFSLKQTNLNFLIGEEKVGFRFTFKTDANQNKAGLVIDDFQINGPSEGPANPDFYTDALSGCEGTEITFYNNTTGSISAISWFFGDGASPEIASGLGPHRVTYLESGNHSVILRVDGIENGPQEIIKEELLQIGVFHSPTIELTMPNILGTSEGDLYQWFFNGDTIPGADSSKLDFNEAGRYSVAVEKNGCIGFSDEIFYDVITSTSPDVRSLIYPNPAINSLYIDYPPEEVIKVVIHTISGKKVPAKIQNSINKVKVNVSDLQDGIYFLTITGKRNSLISKFIINNQ